MARGSSSNMMMSDSKPKLLPSPGEPVVTLIAAQLHGSSHPKRHPMFHSQSEMLACQWSSEKKKTMLHPDMFLSI